MGKSKHIYLFHGENSYDSFQKVANWQNQFRSKYGEDALEIIDGGKLDVASFNTNIESPPFLSEKRLVIIKNLFQQKATEKHKAKLQQIAKNLDKCIDECILIFHETGNADKRTALYKKIAKIGTAEEFKTPDQAAINKWILEKAKSLKLSMDFKTSNFFSQYCGQNLWSLAKEMEKLQTYSNGSPITTEMIEDICIPSISSSIFKLTDSLSQKRLKESIKTVETLTDSGEDLIRIFFMIVRHFRILIQVKDMVQKNETRQTIIKKLKQHPFVIQKTTQQSQNFGSEQLQNIYAQLLEIDRKSKTGAIRIYGRDNSELKLAIQQLIIDCCN